MTLIEADKEAGKQKIAADRDAYVVAKKAEAERDAALKRAEALRAETEGKAEALKSEAAGKATALTTTVDADARARLTRATAEFEASDKEASAKIKLAEALLREGMARAESERLMQEARNAVSDKILLRDVTTSFIERFPDVVREAMAPVAKVSDVRVLQVNGLGGEKGQATVPGTILGTGMALSGALPILREMVTGLARNEDVKQIAGLATDVVRNGVHEVASAIREESAPGPDPRGSAPSRG